jgi:signal transduction histidine kinase
MRTAGHVLGTLTAMRHTPGRPYRADDVALLQDLADRAALAVQNARLLEDAQNARQNAEHAVQQRDTFISIAGHELRTPLTTLRGFTELARRAFVKLNTDLPDGQRLERALAAVDRETRRMERLILALLDVSSAQTGRLTLNPADVSLAGLVERAIAEARFKSQEHQLVVHGLEAASSVEIHADRARLEQVLVNLLDNAIKYSPDGGQIDVTLEAGQLIRVAVRDRGVGIPPEHLPHVFEPYFRAQNKDEAGGPNGLGLGLYVCKQIVELHGGEIAIYCPDDGGTCVTLTLPITGPR